MRKILFLLLLHGLGAALFAQNIVINWGGSETSDYGSFKKTFPRFSNAGYETDGANVLININENSRGRRYKISNLVWLPAPQNELFDLAKEQLTDDGRRSILYYNIDGEEHYNAKLEAFKNENGRIMRLSSFSIEPDDAAATARGAEGRSFIGTTENPLKQGTFYKIKVDKSGVFKITKKFLQDNGINVSAINPKNLRIYGNGGAMLPENLDDEQPLTLQENAIQLRGEEDGRWDDDDYALFYAQGPTGINLFMNSWLGYYGRTDTRNDKAIHLQNIYEDAAYYFITFDAGAGKRIFTEDTGFASDPLTRYDEIQYIDEDKTNLLKLGRVWVADPFTTPKQVSFTTKFPLHEDESVYYRASFVGYNAQGNSLTADINGKKKNNTVIGKTAEIYVKNTFAGTVDGLSGNNLTFNLVPDISVNPNGTFYFDYAEVVYKQDLSFNDAQMNFRDWSIEEDSDESYGFSLSNAASVEQVWDVSDIYNVKNKKNQSSGGQFVFGYRPTSEKRRNEFVAFKNSAAYTPGFVGRVPNQDLSAIENIDYLIITRPEMMAEAQRIAKYHEDADKFKTKIVDAAQIYNEFGSGSQDLSAIRNFISNLKNSRGGLKYVLIIGDASYDYKNKTSGNDNIVSAYESEESGSYVSSFVTDDYIVSSKNQTGIFNSLPHTPVGRLPASNAGEAKYMVDKTLAYANALPAQSTPFGDWRMKLDFVIDNDSDGGGPFHVDMNNVIKANFENGDRSEYNVRKLYLGAFQPETTAGGDRFPQINRAIDTDFSNSLYMFYFGHGGIYGWAQERVFTMDDIKTLNNFNTAYSRLPLVSTITCEFTLWDNPGVQSAGEQVIKNRAGGAATMITSSRAIQVSYGRSFTDSFTKSIFTLQNGDFRNLGDAHLEAKVKYGADQDHLRVNFLGDPAMKLSRPKPWLKIDSIKSPVNGQIRALDKIRVTGSVNKADGTPDEDFAGRVSVSIFDKKLGKATRSDNMPYLEEGAPIAKSSGKAEHGKFSVEFYIPKDINYTVGYGRILAYADNFDTAKNNAHDVFQSQAVKIGDINPTPATDNSPPKISLFMNNTNFADDGITTPNPVLLACLTDDFGINATGAGIGHDITAVLDGQVVGTQVLNDYYTAGGSNGCTSSTLQDYQQGSVAFPFRNLAPGPHQLVVKVWDINNNSSTATLNFVVRDDADQKLAINRLLNWPNPFTDRTYVQFEHNCNGILDVNVQIYTITGRLVRTLSQTLAPDAFLQGFRTPREAIMWDGLDDFGAAVGKGTYIYKVFARSQDQDKCKGSATAVEKMVLLK